MKQSIFLFLITLSLTACQPSSGVSFSKEAEVINASIPPNAQNVKILGNGWATFELEGHKFLFRRTVWDRSATDCVTIVE